MLLTTKAEERNLKRLLIANRGEIAVRITRTARKLGIYSISIYSEADAASRHVSAADEAIPLSGPNNSVYTDGDQIIAIAIKAGAHAIIPGYGFLSENADFARACRASGLVWVGPSAEAIEEFGIKHVARKLAQKAGVPVVPGTTGLVETEEEATSAAEQLGYPVMLKATAGGGGMGLVICHTKQEVADGLQTVRSRGQALFMNPGVFLERYYPASHHIEVQIFGNGRGKAIHFGERECSIQRRHQKVIEECPSPFVGANDELRRKLGDAAVALAESIHYGSVGTVEYLVDDISGAFFFLEMNTRLQVEHGITELCYGVDLVDLMLQQAEEELAGHGGLDEDYLEVLQPTGPTGAAIEARVYAENPLKDYAPSPGLLQKVVWNAVAGSRIDSWVFTGARVTPVYDPLIAKVMFHGPDRDRAVEGIIEVLSHSLISGAPTNLDLLTAIVKSSIFHSGHTLTSFLTSFSFTPAAIEVVSAGAYTTIQDWPGRPLVSKGIPHAGAMDPLALQIANTLVGNARGVEGLEITMSGPELLFHAPAAISLCGAAMDATLDGEPFAMWTRHFVLPGQRLKVGKLVAKGCRSYLAVQGGFPTVSDLFGSKSTSPLVGIGGYQGRQLAPGDLLGIKPAISAGAKVEIRIPQHLIPDYTDKWVIHVMPGPYDEGYIVPEDIDAMYNTEYKVSHNASRAGIRLIGPVPKWARTDGGDGGSHPSNLMEYGYPLGGLNWTGDESIILPMDSPNFGGFLTSTTTISAVWWKLGQLQPGNSVRFQRVSLEDALELRANVDRFLGDIDGLLSCSVTSEQITSLQTRELEVLDTKPANWGKAVILERATEETKPHVTYRQAGEDYLLVEYGDGSFNLNHLCRVTVLDKTLRQGHGPISPGQGLINTVIGCNSLMIYYESQRTVRAELVSYLLSLEDELGDLSAVKVPCRKFRLPISFESKEQEAATRRYMETQRPHAPYLPDNMSFVAESNGWTVDDLKNMYLSQELMAFNVGFFCGATVFLPVDPLYRIVCPKANPSRVFTPAGTVSWGGSCMAIYPVDSPGGFQMTGRTVPYFDLYGSKHGFSPDRPWLFQDFDIVTFFQVPEAEMDAYLAQWGSGRYEFRWEAVEFDMKAHNVMLGEREGQVRAFKDRQARAQGKMMELEAESLAAWRREKAERLPDEETLGSLLQSPDISDVEAPLDANVWKIAVEEGEMLVENQTLLVLEAMKLEIAVRVPVELVGGKVEKVLVSQGSSIQAGTKLVLVKHKKA